MYHKQDSALFFTLVITFPLNYLLPMPPAARQVSSRPALWLRSLKFSLLCSVCVPVTTCYTLDENHQEKHWPTNEHPASLRVRLKVPLPHLSYLLPNTGGSCWWQVSCCQLDRLTQDCPKSPAQKTSPVNWSSWLSATFAIVIAFFVNFRLSHCLQPVNCHKILIRTSWNW